MQAPLHFGSSHYPNFFSSQVHCFLVRFPQPFSKLVGLLMLPHHLLPQGYPSLLHGSHFYRQFVSGLSVFPVLSLITAMALL